MKKCLVILLCLMLVLVSSAACAAGFETVGEKLRSMDKNFEAFGDIYRNGFFKQYRDSANELFDENGNSLGTWKLISEEEVGPWVKVTNNYGFEGAFASGGQSIPCTYSSLSVRDEHWVAGKHVTVNQKESTYVEDWVDVYYDGKLVASVEGVDSIYGKACGAYLCLDKTWVKNDGTVASGKYWYEFDGVVYNPTGEKAFVPGCTLREDEVGQKLFYDKQTGEIVDLQGSVTGHLNFSGMVTIVGDLIYCYEDGTYNRYGKKISAAYSESNCVDYGSYVGTYTGTGIAYIEKDGTVLQSYDFASGEDLDNQYFDIDGNGKWCSFKKADGTFGVMTKEAGVLPQDYYKVVSSKAGGDWFVAQKTENSSRILVDVYGNEITAYGDLIRYTDNGAYAVFIENQREGSMYYHITRRDTAAEPVSDTWVCPVCGNVNEADFAFCPKDGTKKPDSAVMTVVPTAEPTAVPTSVPTAEPTAAPTAVPAAGVNFDDANGSTDYAMVQKFMALEARDNFALKVVSKTITKDGAKQGMFSSIKNDDDLLSIYVRNNGSVAVKSFDVYMIPVLKGTISAFYDDHAVKIFDEKSLSYVTKSDLVLNPGEECRINLAVDMDYFDHLCCLVASYTDTNGNKVENPLFDEWKGIAFGTTQLD